MAGELVLVVDDDPKIRGIVEHFLTDAGYRVVAADGPNEAIEILQTARRALGKLVRQMRHRQGRNLSARLSPWKKSLGRGATAERLKRIAAGPVRSIAIHK